MMAKYSPPYEFHVDSDTACTFSVPICDLRQRFPLNEDTASTRSCRLRSDAVISEDPLLPVPGETHSFSYLRRRIVHFDSRFRLQSARACNFPLQFRLSAAIPL